jgi:putative ABC transport system permease protein
VISRLDRLLRPWGGLGAIPRSLQLSHWTLEAELAQLQNFGLLVPLIFLGVAAFLLNVVLTRTLAIQRSQIASLKALGYADVEIGWHYVKWALLIAGLGTGLGVIGGARLGQAMITLYNQYFRFPVLEYRLSGGVAAGAVAVSLAAAVLGAVQAVRRAVAVPPAEAMRPEAPARYRRGVLEGTAVGRWITTTGRMIVRSLERQPLRALATVIGIALSVTVMVIGLFFIDAVEELKEVQFYVVQRQDATLSFVEPVSAGALHEVERLPGVIRAEPLRAVPARVRFGHRSRNVALTGLEARPELNRVVDRSGRVFPMPPEGLLVSGTLARILGAEPGDGLTLEVLEGARPVREAPVAALVEEYMGLGVYMEIGALRRMMREAGSLSGAYLQVDEAALPELYRALKRLPAVAGVGLTTAALRSFEETLAENLGLMTFFNVLFAGVIGFGVVYNAARISLSERSRELASLRVMGFTRGEIGLVLLGELAILTLLALPLGAALGVGLCAAIVASLESEVYRIPFVVTTPTLARAALTVVAAAVVSGLVVRRQLDRLDLVGVLKTRE